MSRESYIRGFCKVAEAHGVDPVQLAKYAATNDVGAVSGPKYKTDGYVPPLDDNATPAPFSDSSYRGDWIDIPYLYNTTVGRKSPPWRMLLEAGGHHYPEVSPDHELHADLDPRFANWIAAHTNASAKARASLDRVDYPRRKDIPKDLGKMIADIYHDEMKRTTSAPPAQASVPVPKK